MASAPRRPAALFGLSAKLRPHLRRSLGLAGAGSILISASAGSVLAPLQAQAANPCGPPVVSVIACENSQPGTSSSDWAITGSGDATIQGFATDMSVNVGDTVHFKINTPSRSYHLDILRIGYYGGAGARKLAASVRPTASLPQNQPACLTQSSSGLIDCGNWAESASWAVPATAVSGIYFAHLVRDDAAGDSHIFFVVRNDTSRSDLLYQTSDETWQAYNTYGGNSLYQGGPAVDPARAYKVSYNRPFLDAGGYPSQLSWFFNAEYPMVRFLEANGYDVTYTTGIDSDRRGSLITQHKIFISSGHDEYWSGNQFANVQAARDAGVNLAFFSGNEVYWKTRFENSIDATNTAFRTLVCYKETHNSAQIDPMDPPTWTGTWRDPRFSPPADGGRPENLLTGTFFTVNSGTTDIQVPAQFGKLRFWRNTSIASLAPGTVATLAPGAGALGYEWDEDVDNGFRPPGLFDLSSTTANVPEKFVDYGHTVAAGVATHSLTLYRAPSGALVFASGTVQWAYGLDNVTTPSTPTDPRMQQATVNLFADMGAQPFALLPGLVTATKSTETTAPTSTIVSPAAGASFQDGVQVTISGTASDSGGGVVATVEVSTDGGVTWHRATGSGSWSYTWVAHGSPTTTIKSRAVNDSGNVESPSPGISVKVSCPCSIWGNNSPTPQTTSDSDATPVEVGVKFKADLDGYVTAIRFYKGSLNTGTHIGNLWTSTGTLLASATFTAETATGWQQVNFASPVAVFANTDYVASYFAPNGHYANDNNYFFGAPVVSGPRGVDSPPLHALRNGADGPNGVYTYSGSSAFPTSNNSEATNYWVDLVFAPNSGPPVILSNSPPNGATGVPLTSAVTATFSKTINPATLSFTLTSATGTVVPSAVSYNGTSHVASLQPNAALAMTTTYNASVMASDTSGNPMASPFTWSFTSASQFQNGGFETGNLSGWTAGGVSPPTVTTAKPHTGTYSALLGTVSGPEPDGDNWLSQSVVVPSGTSTLTLWYWTSTTDTLCSGSGCVWDWVEGQIRNASGTTLASIFKLNANSQTWTKVTFNMSPYAGQTVVLWFNVREDGSSPPDDTAMYLDDVSIAGTGPTAPGPPTNVSAVAGNAQATVSWTAPASNGGSAITGYTVTSSPGGVTASAGASATSAVVSPLVNGTSYTFTVTASNVIGTSSPSAPSNSVTPSAPTAPGPPTNVSAVAGNAQATVSWTAPASNGGSAITGYTVTSSPGGVTASAGASATSAVVSPLVNGTSYTFTVTASNVIGTSSPSAPSNSVTPSAPTAPGPPTNVSAVAGNAQATVSWTAPASNGGSAITGYTVTSSPGGVTASAGASATSAVVSPLVNGTSYTFTVTASNVIGTSSPSAPSNSVTPSLPSIAFVQQVSQHVGGSASVSVTPATNITAGNRLVVVVGVWNYGSPTTQRVTDSAGNTYTELFHFLASDGTEESVWTAPITSGGGTRPTITATPTASADLGIAVLEYAGLSTATGTSAVDRIAQASGTTTGAATVSSGATAATTATNELAIGFYVDSGFGNALSYGSGFTGRVNVSPAGDFELAVEDQVVGLGATPSAGFGTGASTTWLAATVVFKGGP